MIFLKKSRGFSLECLCQSNGDFKFLIIAPNLDGDRIAGAEGVLQIVQFGHGGDLLAVEADDHILFLQALFGPISGFLRAAFYFPTWVGTSVNHFHSTLCFFLVF